MIIYNVTVKIDLDVHEEWLQWMREVHIPEVLATNLFEGGHRMARVLLQDESDGITYSIQYRCRDMATLQRYSSQFAPMLQRSHQERYQDKFVAFRTVMELVDGV